MQDVRRRTICAERERRWWSLRRSRCGEPESSCRGRNGRARMPCSHFHETRASALGFEEVGQTGFESFPRRYYPDRVRGYLLSPTSWSTPVSVHTIETLRTGGMQIDLIGCGSKTRESRGSLRSPKREDSSRCLGKSAGAGGRSQAGREDCHLFGISRSGK